MLPCIHDGYMPNSLLLTIKVGTLLFLILLSCTLGLGKILVGHFKGLWVARCDGEPYFIPQKIPFLGHIIGFMRFGTKYHLRIRSVDSRSWSFQHRFDNLEIVEYAERCY